jgi:hypothetical protein
VLAGHDSQSALRALSCRAPATSARVSHDVCRHATTRSALDALSCRAPSHTCRARFQSPFRPSQPSRELSLCERGNTGSPPPCTSLRTIAPWMIRASRNLSRRPGRAQCCLCGAHLPTAGESSVDLPLGASSVDSSSPSHCAARDSSVAAAAPSSLATAARYRGRSNTPPPAPPKNRPVLGASGSLHSSSAERSIDHAAKYHNSCSQAATVTRADEAAPSVPTMQQMPRQQQLGRHRRPLTKQRRRGARLATRGHASHAMAAPQGARLLSSSDREIMVSHGVLSPPPPFACGSAIPG